MKYSLLFLTLILALQSCVRPERQEDVYSYFDVDSLVSEQVNRLIGTEKRLSKTVQLDGAEEQSTFQPDTAGWKEELRLVGELSLDKYVGSYQVERSGQKETYLLREGEKSPVKSLEIRYGPESREIEEIRARYAEDMTIYQHERVIEVAFRNNLLTSYRMRGFQKMMMKDTIWFAAEAVVQ